MNKLVKPQKQSYTGDDTQVVAYSRHCEMAWTTSFCSTSSLPFLGSHPFLAAVGLPCFVFSMVCSVVSSFF